MLLKKKPIETLLITDTPPRGYGRVGVVYRQRYLIDEIRDVVGGGILPRVEIVTVHVDDDIVDSVNLRAFVLCVLHLHRYALTCIV